MVRGLGKVFDLTDAAFVGGRDGAVTNALAQPLRLCN